MPQGEGLHRRVVAITVVIAALCLSPAAHGSPPDQPWIGGFYDDADFDDIVRLITSSLSAVEGTMGFSLRPQRSVTSVPSRTNSDGRQSFLSSALGRGPPKLSTRPSWLTATPAPCLPTFALAPISPGRPPGDLTCYGRGRSGALSST